MKKTKSKPKPFESNLPMPIGDLTAHMRKLAVLLNTHGTRMSAVSGKRISKQTAKQLVQLVEELEKIDAERDRTAVGNARDIVREAEDLRTTIAMAVRFVGKDNPKAVAQLARVRATGAQRRSATAVIYGLDSYVALVEEHADIRKLLPKTIVRDAARLEAAYQAHKGRIGDRRKMVDETKTRRSAILRELRTISADVRALAAIMFRSEPELVRQFQLPKRRPVRPRPSRTPPTPPTPA